MVANDDNVGIVLNFAIKDVIRVIRTSPSLAAGPDGYFYNMIKQLEFSIKVPIFHHTLHANVFPTAWKYAKVLPLYKSKSDATVPISLYSCLGKLLERIVKDQLVSFISQNQMLGVKQHGFVNSRSTTTNIFSCDTLIADLESRKANGCISYYCI